MTPLLLSFLLIHTAPSGWTYPLECCSNHDCYEISEKDIEEGPLGVKILATGETWPYDRLKYSPDGHYHRCSVGGKPDGFTYCLFFPPKDS